MKNLFNYVQNKLQKMFLTLIMTYALKLEKYGF